MVIKICSPIKFLFWNFTYIVKKDCSQDITLYLFFFLKEWLASFELGKSMIRKKCHLWGEVILCYVTTSILSFLVNLIVKLNKWECKKVGENFRSTYKHGKRKTFNVDECIIVIQGNWSFVSFMISSNIKSFSIWHLLFSVV